MFLFEMILNYVIIYIGYGDYMKMLKCFFLVIVMNIVFITGVNAECSYKERKELLSAAKGVDVSFESVDNGDSTYSFKFYVVGVTENIFVKYYNLNNGEEKYVFFDDLVDGVYNFVDNNSNMIYQYKFIMYSLNPNCESQELYTKSIKKPMYNIYSDNPNCELASNKNFKYCKKFLDKDYNLTL